MNRTQVQQVSCSLFYTSIIQLVDNVQHPKNKRSVTPHHLKLVNAFDLDFFHLVGFVCTSFLWLHVHYIMKDNFSDRVTESQMWETCTSCKTNRRTIPISISLCGLDIITRVEKEIEMNLSKQLWVNYSKHSALKIEVKLIGYVKMI